MNLTEKRKFMGIWIDKDTHKRLMKRATKEGCTLSHFLRYYLDKLFMEEI